MLALLAPSLILDFLIISAADFLSGGLENHLAIIFYLILIGGSSILVSYRFSLHLALAVMVFNFLLFVLQFNQLYPSNLFLSGKYPASTNLLFSLLERGSLIALLITFERYFFGKREER